MSTIINDNEIITDGEIKIQATDGKVLSLTAQNGMSDNKEITPLGKSELLDEIKNIDGSGSGLDADLVRGLPADFTANLSGNGYQKLPNGLIIQWGVGKSQHDNGYTNTFPITFPNACFSVTANHVGTSGNTNVTCNSATTSNFISYTEYGTTTNITIYYIAIGY